MSALGGQAESAKTTTRPVTERIKASVVKGHLSHRTFCDLSGPLRLLGVARGIVADRNIALCDRSENVLEVRASRDYQTRAIGHSQLSRR